MSSLHERALEALIVQLDAKVTWLESENDRLRTELANSVVVAPKQEKPEQRRAEQPSLLFEPHVSAATPEDTSTKRLSEAQKRAFLTANGWTCHDEIESQNIRVCWEHGKKWYSLEDAYALCAAEISKGKLRGSGWESVVDPVDEIERWKRPGTGELLMFHVACAEMAA